MSNVQFTLLLRIHEKLFCFPKGAVESSAQSMRYVLTQMGKGNAVGLVVGGALEALEAFPGRYNLKLKNKKGFIKLALTTG